MFRLPLAHLLTVAVFAACPLSSLTAQDAQDDNSRSVRILPDSGSPPAKDAPVSGPPAVEAPAAPPPANFAALNTGIKADNTAGLSLEILPGTELAIGTKIAFRIMTKKPGYLILVDVDSSGKLTQIYPNPMSTMRGAASTSNLVKPGAPVTLPDPKSPYAGYEFVAEAPTGVAMVVALLSQQPVQIVDLPDIPAAVAGQPDAFKQVYEMAKNLKIVNGNDSAPPRDVVWSVDAKYYAIK